MGGEIWANSISSPRLSRLSCAILNT
jgi:hypothetical protein